MPQISPNTAIPVSYVTTIPGDVTLYFVRAVLRDTQSSTILQTLNLKNVSSTPNRYTGVFSPVSDPSGLGRMIDITISVYTDSGYTTLSNNYQILQLNYTVLQPWIQGLGTGGGLNIDYEKLQKMFDGTKVTNAEIGNEKAPKKERINYKRLENGVLGANEATRSALSEELKAHTGSLSKILSDISSAHKESTALVGGRFEDLEARLKGLESGMTQGQKMSSQERSGVKNELISAIKEFREEYGKSTEDTSKKSEKLLIESLHELKGYLDETFSEKEFEMVYHLSPQKKEKKQGYAPEDIKSLLRG